MVQTSTIVAATVGTAAAGFIGTIITPKDHHRKRMAFNKYLLTGYAIFFDYKRRNDPNFRKQLKRESKRQARAAKEEAEQSTIRQRQAIKETVEQAKEEGFPDDVEE
jgi:import receptor subunit TOM20